MNCEPQRVQKRGINFIHTHAPEQEFHFLLTNQMRKYDDAIYLDHFASLLQRCHFSQSFASSSADIVSIIGKYPLLGHIAIAIGALDASRKGSTYSFSRSEQPSRIAFRECGISLRKLNTAISMPNPIFREDVFWCIFLHGLFEVWPGLLFRLYVPGEKKRTPL